MKTIHSEWLYLTLLSRRCIQPVGVTLKWDGAKLGLERYWGDDFLQQPVLRD